MSRILVVDDDVAVGKVVTALLEQEGLSAHFVSSGKEALQRLQDGAFDVLITDLRMPEMDGMALLQRVVSACPDVSVVMLTAHGTVPMAVQAMKVGARDFITKPFDREELLFVVRKELERTRLAADSPTSSSSLIGDSPALRDVLAFGAKAAESNATVLIRGESGTGKGHLAQWLHQRSPRRERPFLTVNCGGLPDSLLESELFGYEQGAFPGAVVARPGKLELAHGGTLFFDEIGDTTPAMQVKLLRLLQERRYARLGGAATVSCDVRFLTSTHRSLEEMSRTGGFREDLLHRLAVVPLFLPPLRDRRSDIPALVEGFAQAFAQEYGRPLMKLEPAMLERLVQEPWPGNIRQLKNFVERLLIFSNGGTPSDADLERAINPSAVGKASSLVSLNERRRETEKKALLDALEQANGNRSLAARLLGVSRRTLYNKLETLLS